MTEQNFLRIRLAAAAIALCAPFLLPACGGEKPETPRTDTMAAAPSPAPPLPDSGMGIFPDTTAGMTDSTHPATPGGSQGNYTTGWNRAELVAGVQTFVTAIDSNREEQFWSSLAERSLRGIDQGKLATRREIWSAARETLGDIQNRRITLVGGSRDSVALRIDGLRLIDSVREEDPIIIHLLREGSAWKVMYPGLGYPLHDRRR